MSLLLESQITVNKIGIAQIISNIGYITSSVLSLDQLTEKYKSELNFINKKKRKIDTFNNLGN
jgi:hypothetical protein